MATVPLSIEQYNDPNFCDQFEMAQWHLAHLRSDWQDLIEKLRALQSRYGDLPQDFVDEVGEYGELILDDLRDIDPAYEARQAELERQELHQRYLDRMGYGREYWDLC